MAKRIVRRMMDPERAKRFQIWEAWQYARVAEDEAGFWMEEVLKVEDKLSIRYLEVLTTYHQVSAEAAKRKERYLRLSGHYWQREAPELNNYNDSLYPRVKVARNAKN